MTQPRAYYEGRLGELQVVLRWPWLGGGLNAGALALRYATFKGYRESQESNSKVFQATLDQGTDDRIIPVLLHLATGRASAYASLCDRLLPYLEVGMTEHQLKVLVARVEQDINRCQLLLLGEEP